MVTVIITHALNSAAEKRSIVANRNVTELAVKASREAEERSASERKLQLELARRMKLADFRQNWIDKLREDFSVLLSQSEGEREMNRRIQNILLRMNPKEDAPKEIFEKMLLMINEKGSKEREEISFDLTNLVNRYLKSEWDVLKTEMSEYDKLSKTQ